MKLLGILLRTFMVYLVFTNCTQYSFAQKEQTLCEVTVTAIKPERFMVGQKVKEIDSVSLAQNQFLNLSSYLQFQAPIAFRSYGAGQATNISIRGTSANHSAVLWNGVNINSPSLGQSDFSTLPLAGFDEMSIQYGSAASCVGTDAVGGSIMLKSVPRFTLSGKQFIIGASAETSENYSFQTGMRFNSNLRKTWKISGKTLFYGSEFNNDFGSEPIKNKKGRQYPTEPIKTTQLGFVQDLFALHPNGNMLSLNLWLSDNLLHIQPNKIDLQELTDTRARRIMVSYNLGKTLLRTAYIRDLMDYSRAETQNPSQTDVDRFIARVEHDFSWIQNCDKGTNLKIGIEGVRYWAKVDGYGQKTITENRVDFYALLRYQHSRRLFGSLNLRQAVIEGFNPPFTPSLGIDYRLVDTDTDRLHLSGNVAYSYRVPTLNERYWANLGNPELQPEVGFNKETGLAWKRRPNPKINQEISISLFHNLIDNWTYWNPDKNYRVENLQQVLAKGLELEGKLKFEAFNAEINTTAQYALTHSSQQKLYGPYTQDILGKQLIYIPRHTANSTISVSKARWNVSVQQLFNSSRHITFDHSGIPFPPYYLINAWLSYRKTIKKTNLNFQVQGNNLSNTLYPNLKKNAMPMRSFMGSIIIVFNN